MRNFSEYMETINSINLALKKAAKKDASDFLYAFLKAEDQITHLLKSFDGIKSEIYLQNIDNRLNELLGFSSLFSDIILLNTAPSPIHPSHMMFFEPQHELFRERQVTIPQAYLNETGIDPRSFFPCYSYRNNEETKDLFTKYKSLIKTDRLLVRPLRSLYVSRGPDNNIIYYVNPNTDNDHWYIDDKKQYDFVTIDNGIDLQNLNKLFEITVPFISGIDFEKLSTILQNESVLLSIFRSELKKTITGISTNQQSPKEFTQDILRPEIDKLERKFKKIQSSHRLGVGVSVGTFSLSLVLGTLVGANILQSLAGGIPAVAGGLIMGEKNHKDKIDELKDNPYYLLWQIKRTK